MMAEMTPPPTLNTDIKPAAATEPLSPAPAKAGLMPLFSTWIYRYKDGPVHLNARLEELTSRLRQEERNAARRTNAGGWHYAFDFFEINDVVVTEFRGQMEQHVQAYLNHFRPEGAKKR